MYIVFCQEENKKSTLMLDIDGQNTTYVFASKGTQAMYLTLNLQ